MTPITDLQSLPKISGIYKVIDADNNVLYIGQAKNIYLRWNNGHHKLGKIIARCGLDAYIVWVQIPEWLLNRAENAAIAFYQPPLNMKNSPIV
ncbi:GIY-YIG nuclease family protein [Waterburya agarophytonicola K14]|uniref:GIY-YIG nuclease family protein n=1 Tax=Waterburya agarophytonicola KI4 TaxID=2874699 RepID=A0A964BN71_9CYAN|nr:GIY-YIG nuclease family protein [Waterburya agarophytonicola]MCC0176169.1 GIY-YIG nuclease family protein [Waterburya agarophytonicola KI4]